MSETTSQQPPDDEELVKQLEEQLKKLKVSDLIVQTLYTVSSLGYQKLAGEDRDLAQARLAIETLRVLVPVLEGELGEEAVRDFKQVTANLQLAYADAANDLHGGPGNGLIGAGSGAHGAAHVIKTCPRRGELGADFVRG